MEDPGQVKLAPPETANPFTPLEYDPLKLLNRPEKVGSIFALRDGLKEFDDAYPISVELHLTDLCNLKCPWCTDLELRENMASLSLEALDALFADLAAHDVGITIEGGGEPTVHKRFPDIVASARKHGCDLGLITNGVRPLAEFADAFKWIRVSIDASNEEEYLLEKGVQKFERVMENVAALGAMPEREFMLGVGYVMTNRNSAGLFDYLKALDDRLVDYTYLRPVEEMPELMPSIDFLYDLKSRWETEEANRRRMKVLMNLGDRLQYDNEGLPCIAHSLSCIIQANGNVSMCEKRRHDPVVFGNINTQSFREIWHSDHRREVSQKLLDPESQRGCQVCRITKFNRNFIKLGQLRTRNFI